MLGTGRGRGHHPALSSLERGPPTHRLFRKPSEKSVQFPLWCPRLRSDPCSHLLCAQAVNPPSATGLLCFISGMQPVLKISNHKGPGAYGPNPSPGGEPCHTVSVLFCPRKAVTWPCRSLGVYGEAAKSSKQVICPLCMLLSLPINGHSMAPTGSLCLGDAIYPFPNVFQKGNILSQCNPGDSLHRMSTLGPLSSSPRALLLTWLDSLEWLRCLKPQNLSSIACENL